MVLTMPPRLLLQRMHEAAVRAAQPIHCVPPYLPERPKGRLIVVGAGLDAAHMAQVVEDSWPWGIEGVVVTGYGRRVPCKYIEVIEAASPVPDTAAVYAAEQVMRQVRGLSEDDTVLCLISGGGSGLLALPLPGISLADKRSVHQALLDCGASIHEINCVRRHISAIKGGRLAAAAYPAKAVTLLISDVPGDHASDIASGPTVGDETYCIDALEVVQRYGITLPPHVAAVLYSGAGETIKPSDPRLRLGQVHVIATARLALEAAAEVARHAGVAAHILRPPLVGDPGGLGRVLAQIAKGMLAFGAAAERPVVLLAGAPAEVGTARADPGADNAEFFAALSHHLGTCDGVYALVANGAADQGAAVLSPTTLRRNLGACEGGYVDYDGRNSVDSPALWDVLAHAPGLRDANRFAAVLIQRGAG